MTRKIINVNDPGTSNIVGSDDFDYINRLLTGEDQSATDPVEINTAIEFENSFRLNGTYTMAEISNDVNNYTFASDANNIRLTSDADRNITGFAGGLSGRIIFVHNIGLFNITFKDESTLSTITNRFAFNDGDLILKPEQSVVFWYDFTSGRWRILGSPKGVIGETNTASNVGSGEGVFKTKNIFDLQFRSITATSNKIALANNTNDIGIDVNEANLTLGNIGGTIGDSKIATHTSTKISITNKSQLNSAILYNDVDNDLGTHFLEIGEIAAPANPAANKHRLYIDSVDDRLKRKNSTGTVKDYDSLTSPIGIADGGTGQTTKTNAFDALSPTTTDGDTVYRSGGDNVRLGIGTEGQVMTVVSGLPAWAAAAGGGGSGVYQLPEVGNTIIGAFFGTSSNGGTGIWSEFLTSLGISPVKVNDGTGRIGLRYNLINDDELGGFKTNDEYFTLQNDPELWVRYRYDPLAATHTSGTNYRIVIGFIDNVDAGYGADDALASKSAFLWFKETADTSILVGRNDGDATQDKDSTVSLTQTSNTVHTIHLKGDSANSRFGISLDGGAFTYYTTEIPASTTKLGCIVQLENEGTDDRSFEIFGAYFKAKVI